MKLLSYKYQNNYECGYLSHDTINPIFKGNLQSLNNFLIELIQNNVKRTNFTTFDTNIKLNDVEIIAPLPRPNSFRDAYAFRQHVEAGRKNRGLDMIPEYDQFPVFYFSNHNSIIGPGDVNVYPKHMRKLDFELEIAIIIGKQGMNIKAEDAEQYIYGYTIMNDWSARGLQMEEMKLNLGPAKGKDFATSIGPYITTLESLSEFKTNDSQYPQYDIPLNAYVNNIQISKNNLNNMTWSFSEIIERASYGTNLFPGDIIGSGTCGTGCFLEINGLKEKDQWLQDGDTIKIDAGQLGTLSNTIKLIN